MSLSHGGGTLFEHQHAHHFNGSSSTSNMFNYGLSGGHGDMFMEGYADTKPGLWVLLAVSIAFSTSIIAVRIYYQAFVARIFGRDDAVVALAWVLFLAGVITTGVYLSKPRRTENLSSQDKERFFTLNVPNIIIYSGDYVLLKSSILLQYLRVFQPGQRRKNYVWWSSWAVIWVISLYYGISILLVIFRCFPPDKFWMMGKEGYCLSDLHMSLSSSVVNLSTDIVMFLIPQGKIWTLNLNRTSKIKVSLLFSFALIAVGTAIGRIYVAIRNDKSTSRKLANGSVTLVAWSEIAALFVYSCLPSILMLVHHLRHDYEPYSARRSLRPQHSHDPYQAMLIIGAESSVLSTNVPPTVPPDVALKAISRKPLPGTTSRMQPRVPMNPETYMAGLILPPQPTPRLPDECTNTWCQTREPTRGTTSEMFSEAAPESDVESLIPVPASAARPTGRRQPGQRAIISETHQSYRARSY